MPYIEILAPRAGREQKQAATGCITDAIVAAFSVEPETVTLYFPPIGPEDFAHAGRFSPPEGIERIFVKIHAYRRGLPQRRQAAQAISTGLAAALGADIAGIAVYFFDRAQDEVAHGGCMSCDGQGDA